LPYSPPKKKRRKEKENYKASDIFLKDVVEWGHLHLNTFKRVRQKKDCVHVKCELTLYLLGVFFAGGSSISSSELSALDSSAVDS